MIINDNNNNYNIIILTDLYKLQNFWLNLHLTVLYNKIVWHYDEFKKSINYQLSVLRIVENNLRKLSSRKIELDLSYWMAFIPWEEMALV